MDWDQLSELGPDPLNLDEDEEQDDEHQTEPRDIHPVPETQALSKNTAQFMADLLEAAQKILDEDSENFKDAASMLERLVNAESIWDLQSPYEDDSLVSVALRCFDASKAATYSQFILSLHLMHYRTRVEWYSAYSNFWFSVSDYSDSSERLLTKRSCKVIVEELRLKLDRHKETMLRWKRLGASYCILAGAGTPYSFKADVPLRQTLQTLHRIPVPAGHFGDSKN